MWGLWWTKRHWGRISPSTSVSPASYSTNFTIVIITLVWHNWWPQCRVDPVRLHPPSPHHTNNREQRGGGGNLWTIRPSVEFRVLAQISAIEIQDVRGIQTNTPWKQYISRICSAISIISPSYARRRNDLYSYTGSEVLTATTIDEEFYLLGHNTTQSGACRLLHAGFWLGLLFEIEDGGDMFLRNVGYLSSDYMMLHPIMQPHRCHTQNIFPTTLHMI
jgi:hypothetical protein